MLIKRRRKWDIDLALCSLLVLVSPYAIYDLLARSIFENQLFQVSWIVILLCISRLFLILLESHNSEGKRIREIFRLYFPIMAILMYTVLSTIMYITNIHTQSNVATFHDPYSFILSRGAKYTAYLALSIYFAITLWNKSRIAHVVRLLALGLCFAEILAVVQLIVFQTIRYNLFPIVRTNSENWLYIDPVISFSGISLLRLNSISHEPKGLAALMCLLILLKIFWNDFKKDFYPERIKSWLDLYMRKTWAITLAVTFLTFSNNSITMLIFILLVLVLYNLWGVYRIKLTMNQMIFVFFITALILIVSISYGDEISKPFTSFFDVTINRRLGSAFSDPGLGNSYQKSIDPEDGAVLYILDTYPFSSILYGFGFGGFSNTSYPFVSAAYGVVRVSPFSRNILIELFFSSGIIGLCFSIYFFGAIALRHIQQKSPIHLMFGLYVLINVFLRSNEIMFFVSIGVLVSCTQLKMFPTPNYYASHR